MRVRSSMTAVIALAALLTAVPSAVASTDPSLPLWTPHPVAPVVQRGYPCTYSIGGPYDQYLYVWGGTLQTRVGAADVYSATTGAHLFHRGLFNGYTVIHSHRDLVGTDYRVSINGIGCGLI